MGAVSEHSGPQLPVDLLLFPQAHFSQSLPLPSSEASWDFQVQQEVEKALQPMASAQQSVWLFQLQIPVKSPPGPDSARCTDHHFPEPRAG
jgi:hypothetical protein